MTNFLQALLAALTAHLGLQYAILAILVFGFPGGFFLGRWRGKMLGYIQGWNVGFGRVQQPTSPPQQPPSMPEGLVGRLNEVDIAVGALSTEVARAVDAFDAATREVKKARAKPAIPTIKRCRNCGTNLAFYSGNSATVTSCTHTGAVSQAMVEQMAMQFQGDIGNSMETLVSQLRDIVGELRDDAQSKPGPDLGSYWAKLKGRAAEVKEEKKP